MSDILKVIYFRLNFVQELNFSFNLSFLILIIAQSAVECTDCTSAEE